MPAIPDLDELLACAHVVAIPTRTRFRGIHTREAVLFEAPNGASEFSPFPEYPDAEARWWLSAAIEYGWGVLPAPRRESIEINATVPAVAAAEVPAVLERFSGCHTAKVKVAELGHTLADDIARVAAVREIMGTKAHIRVDANGAWGVHEAATALQALAPFALDYVEQPCASVSELQQLRQRLAAIGLLDTANAGQPPLRIAADESVRKTQDPLRVARSGAVDLLVVKVQPLGGIARALHLIERAGLPVVVSSALDTSVGIGMGLRLAAALDQDALAGACGLGTVSLLRGDVTREPFTLSQGRLEVRRPTLDQERLHDYAATAVRTQWWRERLARCYRLLAQLGDSSSLGE